MDGSLAQVPLLRAIPARELKTLGSACELRRFHKGDTVFEEDQRAECVWIVKRGWVYLVKRTPQGGLATIFTMTPDEALCGVSAFDHGTYSAGAVAATDSQLIKIPAAAFARLLERYPKFAQAVLLTCCNRMRHMAEAISFSQAPVEQRVIYTLLRLRSTFGNTLPIIHQELARMAGIRLETSIRAVATLKRRRWVSTSRGQMTLLRPDRLKASLAAVQSGVRPLN
jgi:CRP-like cAMP-binding protein